ncbi:MAG: thiamine phosphate synthase [Gemmatimonadetes bacterium]|nr:thiamine phosphate synthase [Gemmatimonadota bacterium]
MSAARGSGGPSPGPPLPSSRGSRPDLSFLLDLPARDPLRYLEAFLPRLAGAWRTLDMVQVRAKGVPAGTFAEAVRRVRRALAEGTLLVANDRLDVALAGGADGVHVGADDLPPEAVRSTNLPAGFLVGLTCHKAEELRAAPERGANYVGVGAFFASSTKDVTSNAREALLDLSDEYPLPVYGIGGITSERLTEVMGSFRLSGVVVSSAIQRADNPADAARELREALDGL